MIWQVYIGFKTQASDLLGEVIDIFSHRSNDKQLLTTFEIYYFSLLLFF